MTITNASLAQSIADLVQKDVNIRLELQAWINGTAGGGPSLNGTYPLTDYLGNVTLVKCPAQLQEDVTGIVNSATTLEASVSANAATVSTQTNAVTTLEAATKSHRDSAAAHSTSSGSSASQAATSEANALAFRNSASADRAACEVILADITVMYNELTAPP